MKMKKLFAILLTLALFTAGHAQTLDKAKLDQFFDRLAEKNKAMGSLTVARGGNVLYTRAIGYSQISGTEKKPLTAASRFRIGSITKMFTAAMILQLVEEGKLKLTDTLDKFFPQIPNAKKITIVQILSHRSGIPNVRRDQNSQGNVNTTPITKDPYEEALKERITSKIGLKDTYTATGSIDVNKNESLTYMNLGGDWKQVPETHRQDLLRARGRGRQLWSVAGLPAGRKAGGRLHYERKGLPGSQHRERRCRHLLQ